jgi:NitT/TauT family transport system substrate-binding protein
MAIGRLLLVALLVGPAPPVFALEKMTVIHSVVSGSQAVLAVTRDAKIFEKHGLDVELRFAAGGPVAVSALLAGEAQAAVMAGPASVSATLGGADTVVIMALVNTMDHRMFARKPIKKPDDLRGKKLAVVRYGSADDFAARYTLTHWGLTPGRDVAILQMGTQATRLNALRAGTVDATLLQPPLSALARKDGFSEIATLADLGLEYLQTCVTTTRTLVKSREDLIKRFVLALVDGIHFYKTNREASLASIARFMGLSDRHAIEESYETYALKLTGPAPLPTAKGVQTILDSLAEKDPRARGAAPERFIEPRFVQELEATGVIDRLYRSGS